MQTAEKRKAEEEARRKEQQRRRRQQQHQLQQQEQSQQQQRRMAAMATAVPRAPTSMLAELSPLPSISRIQRSALSDNGDADLEDGEIEKVLI